MLPIPDKIGYFYAKENQEIDPEIGPEFIKYISEEKYQHCSDFIVPSWFMNKKNFEAICSADFLDIMPMTAEVVPSLICPFRCHQCSYKPQKKDMGIWGQTIDQQERSDLLMSEQTMDIVIDKLYQSGMKNLVITGGGEPLANPNVVLHSLKKAKKLGISTCLYTNGYLLSSKLIKQLVNIDPVVTRISIYGIDGVGFSSYTKMPQEGYRKVFQNLKTLITEKIDANANLSLSISFLVHPIMFKHFDLSKKLNLIDLFINTLGEQNLKWISTIRFTPAVDYYNREQHDISFFKSFFANIEEEIPVFLKYGVRLMPYYHRLKDLYDTKSYHQCLGSGFYAEIGINGEMYQCCEKLLMPEYSIGNILENTVEEIYHSEKRKRLCSLINKEIRSCPSVCKPHEINKILSLLPFRNGLEKEYAISTYRLNFWYRLLIQHGRSSPVALSRYNPFES